MAGVALIGFDGAAAIDGGRAADSLCLFLIGQGAAIPNSDDLICVGSVLTHRSASALALLQKLISWTRIKGVVAVTLHGRRAIEFDDRDLVRYIRRDPWKRTLSDYTSYGCGYADYPEQRGYGASLLSLDWAAKQRRSRLEPK